jgi:hypothetical protein
MVVFFFSKTENTPSQAHFGKNVALFLKKFLFFKKISHAREMEQSMIFDSPTAVPSCPHIRTYIRIRMLFFLKNKE